MSEAPVRHELTVVVLAAGGGTRMKSKTMKVLHPLAGRTMVGHVLAAVRGVEPHRVVAVVGHQRDEVGPHIQQLMPDVLHWLGITRVDRFVSMSNMKYEAIVGAGIDIGERVPIPPELVPPDASVELAAKKAAGYFSAEPASSEGELTRVIGRKLEDF